MLTSYRRILAEPGRLAFSLTGLFARLPISMVGLGIVLLVEAARGSYGIAGVVSAAFMAANAVMAILQGRLLDTLGQGIVLASASSCFGVSMVLLISSVQADWPMGLTYVAAALSGASLPQISSCVRARWAHVVDAPEDLQTAFALEAVLDEVVYIIGPILVTVLATVVHPAAGLITATVAGVVGGLGFAAQRSTEPPAAPIDRAAGGVRAPLPWATLAPLLLGCIGLGLLFGAAEVTTVAFAEEQGNKAWAGGLLALWALGSLGAGVVSGGLAWKIDAATRLRRGSIAMACAMAPLIFVDSLGLMGLLLVGGVAIAPTMIAAMTLTQQRMPSGRLTEGMSVIQTGLVIGVAPGAALSGFIVDQHGASAAYVVSLGAGLLAALAAQLVPRQRSVESPEPLPLPH